MASGDLCAALHLYQLLRKLGNGFKAKIGISTCNRCHKSQIRGDCNGNLKERGSATKLVHITEIWFLSVIFSMITLNIILTDYTTPHWLFCTNYIYIYVYMYIYNQTCDITHLMEFILINIRYGSWKAFYASKLNCGRFENWSPVAKQNMRKQNITLVRLLEVPLSQTL